jgi:dTDP-4-amino-4,6-dideoxygalactose transaminase
MMPSGKTTSGTQWRVPFMRPDLPPYADVAREMEAAVASGLLTKGPHLRSLEEKVGAACGTSDAVGVSSCTSGLMLVLRAIASFPSMRVSTCACEWCPPACRSAPAVERDEVILPSFNFLAAPAAVVWAGLRPVFVDVDPRTFTVDAAAVKAAITPRTAAILACHTFGCPCDMSALTAIAGTAGVPLVVDAAHGLGSTQDGRQVGAGGLAQVFSMSPTKLVVAGEGGVVATSCGCLADALRVGREYGNDGGYDCDRAGLNARLPELSAILGRASMARLPVVAARRREVADTYIDILRDEPGIGFQAIPSGSETSWKDFCIAIDPALAGMDRDALRAALASRGIDTRAYYSPACHRMPAFAPFFAAGHSLPVTDRLAATLVALPMGGHVTPDVAALVGREIRQVLSGSRRTAGA